jgi:hypothetical protein
MRPSDEGIFMDEGIYRIKTTVGQAQLSFQRSSEEDPDGAGWVFVSYPTAVIPTLS